MNGLSITYNFKERANNLSTDSLYYVFKDHLGSYDRVTNQKREIIEVYSFDAWGNRRSPNFWNLFATITLFCLSLTDPKNAGDATNSLIEAKLK